MMTRETYTRVEAVAELDRRAKYHEDENYHTEAAMLWDLQDLVALDWQSIPRDQGKFTITVPDGLSGTMELWIVST